MAWGGGELSYAGLAGCVPVLCPSAAAQGAEFFTLSRCCVLGSWWGLSTLEPVWAMPGGGLSVAGTFPSYVCSRAGGGPSLPGHSLLWAPGMSPAGPSLVSLWGQLCQLLLCCHSTRLLLSSLHRFLWPMSPRVWSSSPTSSLCWCQPASLFRGDFRLGGSPSTTVSSHLASRTAPGTAAAPMPLGFCWKGITSCSGS